MRVSIGYTAFTTNVSPPFLRPGGGYSFLNYPSGKRRYNIKLWKTFTDCFNCLPIAAIIDEKIFTMHGGLSPDLQSMEQIRRVMRPTDVPDTGVYHLCRRPVHTHILRTSQDFYAISFGPIQTRISPDGQRMTVVYPLHLVRTLYQDSCKNMIWT